MLRVLSMTQEESALPKCPAVKLISFSGGEFTPTFVDSLLAEDAAPS
jgi:hypothetical protein